MAQLMKVGRVHTTQGIDNDGCRYVQYHATKVVRWNDKYIFLRTDGYYTQTTKNRMNQVSNQFNLGFKVYQKDFEWFVRWNNKDINIRNFDGRICLIR